MSIQGALKFRLRAKTSIAPKYRFRSKGNLAQMAAAKAALAAECDDDEIMSLPTTVKRKHVHWTHTRTHNPEHKRKIRLINER